MIAHSLQKFIDKKQINVKKSGHTRNKTNYYEGSNIKQKSINLTKIKLFTMVSPLQKKSDWREQTNKFVNWAKKESLGRVAESYTNLFQKKAFFKKDERSPSLNSLPLAG